MTPGVEKGWDGNGNSMLLRGKSVCVCVSVNRAPRRRERDALPVTRGWAERAAPGALAFWPIVVDSSTALEVLRVIANGRALWYLCAAAG